MIYKSALWVSTSMFSCFAFFPCFLVAFFMQEMMRMFQICKYVTLLTVKIDARIASVGCAVLSNRA